MKTDQPSLEEIRAWPPTVNVRDAARALGISTAHAYATISAGNFPGRIIVVGNRIKVTRDSLLSLLEEDPIDL